MVHHLGMIDEIEIYGDSQKKQKDIIYWLSNEFSAAETTRPAGHQRSTKINPKRIAFNRRYAVTLAD